MNARASADLLIDRERLSEVLGRSVRATRLRFKPGLSTTAALVSAAGEAGAPGWVQVCHPGHSDKIRKAVALAGERGRQVSLLEVDGLTVVHGTVDTDPRLQKGLDVVRRVHRSIAEGVTAGRLTVLRYNPQRRLVMRRDRPTGEPWVLRVSGSRQEGYKALRHLVSAGVPVVEPLRCDGHRLSSRVTVWPWFGRGDLASVPAEAGGATAYAVGEALARLHGSAAWPREIAEPVAALVAQAEDLADLDAAAATRMRALTSLVAARITAGSWATGPTHGDFSADQVLVGRSGEDPVRLTDFDRAGTGPLLADVGSFAAAELLALARDDAPSWHRVDALPQTGALLAGYADATGPGVSGRAATGRHTPGSGTRGVTDADLRTWVARSLLTRVAEPFRAADPDWVAGIHRRLDQAEQVLS